MLLKDIWKDVKAVQERDPAARGAWEVLVLCQGVHALIWHGIAHWFWLHHMKFVGRLISQLARFFTLIEIHPGATLGHGILIDHGCRSSGQSREDRRRSSAGHKKTVTMEYYCQMQDTIKRLESQMEEIQSSSR